MSTIGTGGPTSGPIDPRRRLDAIDMVRGFALFGVLLVNLYNFGAYSPLWTDVDNRVAFSLMRAFFETKSWRLFSFLFGLGFSLQWLRADARGTPRLGPYLRRMLILFLIGAGHALLYDGDILMLYAELGVILTLFWRVPPRPLLATAVCLLAVFPVSRTLESLASPANAVTSDVEPDVAQLKARRNELLRTHPYAVGSVGEVMAFNAHAIPPNPIGDPVGPESNLAFFAMFLLGLYAGKRRLFEDVGAHVPFFRSALRWGIILGLAGSLTERALALGWGYDVFGDSRASWPVELIGSLAFAYGSTALALGYAAAIVIAARHAAWRPLVAPLAAVGRMALSVYLTQSLIFTTLFYGYGLGQVDRMGPFAVSVSAVLIFALQVACCTWWMRRFRFGPMEWLWRALTYLRLPSMAVGPGS